MSYDQMLSDAIREISTLHAEIARKEAALDHPLLRQLFGEIEDSQTKEAARLWQRAVAWFDVRDAALSRAPDAPEPSAPAAEQEQQEPDLSAICANPITVKKAQSLLDLNGGEITGFFHTVSNGTALIDKGAVRWLTPEQWQELFHGATNAPARTCADVWDQIRNTSPEDQARITAEAKEIVRRANEASAATTEALNAAVESARPEDILQGLNVPKTLAEADAAADLAASRWTDEQEPDLSAICANPITVKKAQSLLDLNGGEITGFFHTVSNGTALIDKGAVRWLTPEQWQELFHGRPLPEAPEPSPWIDQPTEPGWYWVKSEYRPVPSISEVLEIDGNYYMGETPTKGYRGQFQGPLKPKGGEGKEAR